MIEIMEIVIIVMIVFLFSILVPVAGLLIMMLYHIYKTLKKQ